MKRKLLLAMVALLSIVGVRQVHAYTVEDLKNAGWSEVTDLSALTLNDNYFILIDAGTSKYSVSNSRPGTDSKPTYQDLQDPEIDYSQVWIISSENSAYYLQSIVDEWYFIGAANSGQGWTDKMAVTKDNGNFEFSYSEGKYSIKSIFANGLVGPWNDDGSVNLSNKLEWGAIEDNYHEELACNKSAAQAPGFYLFSISKTKYEENRYYSGTLEKEGWSKVASVDGLGLYGYYYTFLDASELGYETGLMLTGIENARHQYQLAEDPIKEKSKLWTTEAHGIGYALKNASYDKYLYCPQSWETNSTNDINTNNTDFSFKLNDGKWELSNAISTSQFVGRWGTSAYNPGVGEQIPANKAAGAGKRLFAIYSIPTIAGVATQLPEGGAMEAGNWYYIDIAIAGKYSATSSDLQNIVYTTDGSVLVRDGSSITNVFTATDNELEVTRYYVKSSAATTLVVAPASFDYIVGSATTDVSYIQADNTVTISYSELATNNPDAAVVANLGAVTFSGGSITCAATENGFTFTVPKGVAANTEYTLTIPANTIGYEEGNKYNEAQTITLKTPAVFDGTYFFRVESTFNGTTTGTSAAVGKYLARGKSAGTHATIDAYGLPIIVATDGENNTTLSPADTKRYYYHAGEWESWADKASVGDDSKFNITLNDGVYKISSTMNLGKYFKYNDKNVDDESIEVYDDGEGANAGPIINWAIETVEEHATAMQNKKDAQAAASAAAAYASGNYASLNGIATVEALEAALEKNYIQGYFKAPSEIESVKEKYQGAQVNGPEKVYSDKINITEPGFYKFSMQAFYRLANNNNSMALQSSGAAFPPVVLFFAGAETQIKSLFGEEGMEESECVEPANKDLMPTLYNGKYYPNDVNNSKQAFVLGKYHNDVWVYISEPGEYEYGVKYMGWANDKDPATGHWFIYSPESVTINSYAAAADPTDYANLAAAIATAKANAEKLGFDEGEYAPYNNIEVMNAIPAAEEIDTKEQNSKLIVLSAIKNLENWTVNETEVNAFGDPDFSKSGDNAAPLGWTSTSDAPLGGGTNSRAFVRTSGGTDYAKLASFGQGDGIRSAGYFRFDDSSSKTTSIYTYGEKEGYTMPLKADLYQFKAQVGAWGNVQNLKITFTDNEDVEIASEIVTLSNPANNLDELTGKVVDVDIIIDVKAAGNYKLKLSNAKTTEKLRVAISNLELKKAVTPSVAINNAGYVTFSSQYAVDLDNLPAGLEAYYVQTSGIHSEEKYVSLTLAEGIVKAGQGLIFKGAVAEYSIPLSAKAGTELDGNILAPGEGEPVAEDSYVFSWDGTNPASAGFYRVGSTYPAVVPVGKAYLPASNVISYANVLRFVFGDDNATAIETVATDAEADGVLYNVAGQQVGKDYKGIVIKNGKKYLNK